MPTESFLLRFFWGPREEGPESMAARLCRFLNRLGRLDPLFKSWQQYQKSSGEMKPIPRTKRDLSVLCAKGIMRSNIPPYPPMPGGGCFTVNIDTKATWVLPLRVFCGCTSENLWNSVILYLPVAGEECQRICNVSVLEELVRATVDCWDPDVGQIWSSELADSLIVPMDGIEIGWLTYVSKRKMRVPDLPASIRVSPVGQAGTLIVATEDLFSTNNPEHHKRAISIATALNPGLLFKNTVKFKRGR